MDASIADLILFIIIFMLGVIFGVLVVRVR